MTAALHKIEYIESSAKLSHCRMYRYHLHRRWANGGTSVLWVMLNPSLADDSIDDPTVRKCVGFSRRWGHGEMAIVNLYAYRTHDPKILKVVEKTKGRERVVGEENDRYIDAVGMRSTQIVAAWGAHADADRAAEVLRLLNRRGPVQCLGRTSGGQPRHPLMLKYDTPLVAL